MNGKEQSAEYTDCLNDIYLNNIFDYSLIDNNYLGIFNFPLISSSKQRLQSNSVDFGIFIFQSLINGFNIERKSILLSEYQALTGLDFTFDSKLKSMSIKSGFNSTNSGMMITDKEVKKNKNNYLLHNIILTKLSFQQFIPNGTVYSFGNNINNETSHNGYEVLSLPRVVYKLKEESIVIVKCGWENSCVINDKNKIFSWGNNESGQCGGSTDKTIYNPQNLLEF